MRRVAIHHRGQHCKQGPAPTASAGLLQLQQHVQQAIQQGNAGPAAGPRQPAQHVAGVVAQQQHRRWPQPGTTSQRAGARTSSPAAGRSCTAQRPPAGTAPGARAGLLSPGRPKTKSGPLVGSDPAAVERGAISHQLKQAHGHKVRAMNTGPYLVARSARCRVHRVHKGHAKAVGAVARCGACGGVFGGAHRRAASSANAAPACTSCCAVVASDDRRHWAVKPSGPQVRSTAGNAR